MRQLMIAAVVGVAVSAALAGNDIRVVEKLPRTEQLESGELSLQRLSDRQLVALIVDLVKRIEFDRSQNDGKPGRDGAYLKAWLDKVIAEMESRKMAADGDGLIDVPAEK